MKRNPTYTDFENSLNGESPPDHWPGELKAMWFLRKGDWNRAHTIAQDLPSSVAHRIHGYLHWVEGDLWNAGYWYRQAGVKRPDIPLEEEARNIVTSILKSITVMLTPSEEVFPRVSK